MTDEEFEALTPFERQSCYDCKFCQAPGRISWWCMNEDARRYRGTSIPGVIKCHFWQPDWDWIEDEFKTEENGYKKFIIHKPVFNHSRFNPFKK